jgi:hypothetical protein
LEVISETPAIPPNARSSGVATVEAIVSGDAPGKDAETEMVGNSTWGKGATGSLTYAKAPPSANPSVSKVVPIGRTMKKLDKLMGNLAWVLAWVLAWMGASLRLDFG